MKRRTSSREIRARSGTVDGSLSSEVMRLLALPVGGAGLMRRIVHSFFTAQPRANFD